MIDLDQFEGHTPGPWWAVYEKGKAIVIGDANRGVALIPNDQDQPYKQKDANLIAAAPTLLAELRERQKPCEWHEEDGGEYWESSCGQEWTFIDGGPKENGCHFCHNCGHPIKIAALEAAGGEE